jgi:hypothetical protein
MNSSFVKYPKRKYQYILEVERAIEHTKQFINRKRKRGRKKRFLVSYWLYIFYYYLEFSTLISIHHCGFYDGSRLQVSQ